MGFCEYNKQWIRHDLAQFNFNVHDYYFNFIVVVIVLASHMNCKFIRGRGFYISINIQITHFVIKFDQSHKLQCNVCMRMNLPSGQNVFTLGRALFHQWIILYEWNISCLCIVHISHHFPAGIHHLVSVRSSFFFSFISLYSVVWYTTDCECGNNKEMRILQEAWPSIVRSPIVHTKRISPITCEQIVEIGFYHP